MTEPNQTTVPKAKNAFRNFATGYAILVPAVIAVDIVSFIETEKWLPIPPGMGALLFLSSFVMGLVTLFDKSAAVAIRALVFVAMLVGAVCGLLAPIAWSLSTGGLDY